MVLVMQSNAPFGDSLVSGGIDDVEVEYRRASHPFTPAD